MSVLKHWLSRKAVNAPSLEVFETTLDGALRNLRDRGSYPCLGFYDSTFEITSANK